MPKTGLEKTCAIRNPKCQHSLPFWSTNICFTLHFTSKIHLQPPWVRKLSRCPSRHAMKLNSSYSGWCTVPPPMLGVCSLVSYCICLNFTLWHWDSDSYIFIFTSWLPVRLCGRGLEKEETRIRTQYIWCSLSDPVISPQGCCFNPPVASIPVMAADYSSSFFNIPQRT